MGNAWTVRPARRDEWSAALALQFAPLAGQRQAEALDAALKGAAAGTLELSHLFIAERDGCLGAVTLVTLLPDGVGVTWPASSSLPTGPDRDAALDAVLQGVVAEFARENVIWGQCLADCIDGWETAPLVRAGFQPGGRLLFLARGLRDLPEFPYESDLVWESYTAERNANRFAQVLDASYQESCDCPLINGLRTGEAALASHQLSGEFQPEWWRLYQQGEQDAAILLLGDHPDEDAVELVYVGVAPECRGSGLGRRLVAEGLRVARERGRAALFLAVDEKNCYATRVYDELGFVELARRELYLWLRSSSAQE